MRTSESREGCDRGSDVIEGGMYVMDGDEGGR